MLDGNRINNPFYVRLKDRQDERNNTPAMADDATPVLPMASQDDTDSRINEKFPSPEDCRQIETRGEFGSSDGDFHPLEEKPVISDDGELLSPSSAFPLVPVSPQPVAEEDSGEDVSADSQT